MSTLTQQTCRQWTGRKRTKQNIIVTEGKHREKESEEKRESGKEREIKKLGLWPIAHYGVRVFPQAVTVDRRKAKTQWEAAKRTKGNENNDGKGKVCLAVFSRTAT